MFLVVFLSPIFFVKAVELGGLDDAVEQSGMKSTNNIYNVPGKILNPVLSFVGVLFFVLLLYSGILWMTAMGDEKKIELSKKILTAAIIGLLVVASAYAITRFVGQSLISPTTTKTTT